MYINIIRCAIFCYNTDGKPFCLCFWHLNEVFFAHKKKSNIMCADVFLNICNTFFNKKSHFYLLTPLVFDRHSMDFFPV